MRRTGTALTATLATLALAAPAHALTATTGSAVNVTDTSATMRGKVDPGLLSVVPSFYFEYGRTQAYGSKTPATAFSMPTIVKLTLIGVPSSTTIHYRIVATGLLSTARGADMTFTTLDPPPPPPDPSSSGSSTPPTDSGSGSSPPPSGSGSGSTPPPSGSGSGSTPPPSGSGSSSSGSGSPDSGSASSGSGSGTDPQGSDGSSGDAGSGAGSGDSATGSEQLAVAVSGDDSDKPVLGSTIGAAPEAGSIAVQTPGSSGFTPLPDGAPIPVGSTIDARNGSVNVVTALGKTGKVQTATFKGAVFQVKQSRKASGLTDIYLRGGDFSSCRPAPSGAHLLAKKKKGHAIRKLWGHDHHGRFRTHGRGAIATVRGTTWVVADHCDGTRTSVISGAVSVRDTQRHKTVLVHAGHSYFARTHH
jgi:hypothetical protein